MFFRAIQPRISRRDWLHQFRLVGEWDVALYEIHYKRLWHAINPIDAEIIYEINPTSTPEESSSHRATVYLYQGYYSTIEEVVTSLNSLFNNLKTLRSWNVCLHSNTTVERGKSLSSCNPTNLSSSNRN